MAEKDSTRDKIIQGFKKLLTVKDFKRITIKDITDEAGIFRATFYTYFPDKHALFEAILEDEIFFLARGLAENGMAEDAIVLLIRYFEQNYFFYQRAFMYTGANSCEEALHGHLLRLLDVMTERSSIRLSREYRHVVREDQLKAYLAEMILFNLRWLVRAKSGGDTKFKSEIMLAFMLRGLEDFLE